MARGRSRALLVRAEATSASRDIVLGVAMTKLTFVSCWVKNSALVQAQELNPNGMPKEELIATGVDSMHARLIVRPAESALREEPDQSSRPMHGTARPR